MKHILVVGSSNVDTTLLMDRLPEKGETLLANGKKISVGGKGLNQAIALRKMGCAVRFLSAVGRDESAELVRGVLKENEIPVDDLLVKEAPTGTAMIATDKAGDNMILVDPGANFEFTPEDIDAKESLFEDAAGCVMQHEIPEAAIAEAARLCEKHGVALYLNPAPAKKIPGEILKRVDYLIPNETEFALITGAPAVGEGSEEALRALLDQGVKNVLVTLGGDGSLLYSRKGERRFPAKKVQAIDTTAAGDSFIGAFTAGRAEGMTEEEAIGLATEVASRTVCRRGAAESIPRREEL